MRWATGLVLAGVVGLVAWVQQDQDHEVVPPGGNPGRSAGAAASLVRELELAVRSRDLDAVESLAAPGGVEQLSAVLANAEALDVRDFSARYVDETGGVRSDDSWTGVVELRWLLGQDDEPSRAELAVDFVPTDLGLRISGVGGGGGRTPLWLAGPLEVARTPEVLVMSRSSTLRTRRILAQAVRGLEQVEAVLPGRADGVTIEVAASASELDAALGAPAGSHEQIAAVTTAVDGASGPVHVFVNPQVAETLRPQGAQVVMTHEIVHVATEDAERDVTPWLSEGLADYVALRDVALPETIAAGRALRAVRRGGVPSALPGKAEFATDFPRLQASYELAWLACVVVAETLGEDALLDLHASVASGTGIADALTAAGWSQRELLSAWQQRLETLSGARAG